MKKLLLVLTAAGAVAGTPFVVPILTDTETPAEAAAAAKGLFEVARRDLDIRLTENGTLVAKDSVKLTANIRGQGRITVLAAEGKTVEENEVVCELDTTEAQKEIEQLELDLLSAQTALTTARTELEIQKADNISQLEKAASELEKTEKELERYRDGDAPQELHKLEVDLKDTETAFNRAKKKYEDSLELLELNYIRQSEVEDHQIEFERARVSKESAELGIRLFEKYTRPMTTSEREIAFRTAQRDLETTKKRAESQLLQKQVAVTQAEKRVQRLQEKIDERKEDVANMTLRAPVPGVVIYGDPRNPWQAEQVKIGGTIWQGLTLMTIPDLRVMLVKLEVHEADINKVAVGQAAKVTFDTYPGLVLDGKVTQVAQIAGSSAPPWERQDVKKFDVEVTITGDPETKLKPGISAKVEIALDHRDNALFVPIQCVFLENGRQFCHVQEGGRPVRREVHVGASNDNYTEILDGLEQGDRVLLYNPDLPAAERTEPALAEDGATPAAVETIQSN